MEKSNAILEWSLEDHGIDNPQYFQGHGVSCTDWDDCATGCGDNPREAGEDALEQLAQQGYEIPPALEQEISALPESPSAAAEQEKTIADEIPAEITAAVRHLSHSGMGAFWVESLIFDDSEGENGAGEKDAIAWARKTAAERIRLMRRRGFPTMIVTMGEEWEVLEPDDCAMVPHEAGIISLSLPFAEQREEIADKRERAAENWDSNYYYLSVDIKTTPAAE